MHVPSFQIADRIQMTKPVINHGRYVPALINFLGNKLAAGASSAYRREFGVGVTEWRILSKLASEDACTAQQICQYFDLDKGLVSRTLKSLVDNGSVTVTDLAGDNRRVVILTNPAARCMTGSSNWRWTANGSCWIASMRRKSKN